MPVRAPSIARVYTPESDMLVVAIVILPFVLSRVAQVGSTPVVPICWVTPKV